MDKTTLTANRENFDLTTHVPDGFEGELKLNVITGEASPRQFTVYCRSLPEFRCEELDTVLAELQKDYSLSRNNPDIERWRNSVSHVANLGELEHRYIDGFYEYLLAFSLDEQGFASDAKTHFEDAFGLLLPFRTPLADSAVCVLGLRMNCFEILRRAPRTSVVSGVDCFFNQSLSEMNWRPPESWTPGDAFATYADEFTVRYVDAVASFFASDQAQLNALVQSLDDLAGDLDKNNEDKLLLLKARLFRRQPSERRRARAMYERLRYNPLFSSEAEEFLNE